MLLPAVALAQCLALAVSGAVLALVGLVGWLPVDRPRCRRCGKDLRCFGDVPATCDRCRADLVAAGSVRFGPRERRPRLVVGGAALALAAATSAALLGFLARWTPIAPPRPVATPAPPSAALPPRAAMAFAAPSVVQPALISARTLPTAAGPAIEIILDASRLPRIPRFEGAALQVGENHIVGTVRSVSSGAAPTGPVLVVVIDLPAARSDSSSASPAVPVQHASRLELRARIGGSASLTWAYGEPFVRGTIATPKADGP